MRVIIMKYQYQYFMANGEKMTLGNVAVRFDILVDHLMVIHEGETVDFGNVKVTRCESEAE